MTTNKHLANTVLEYSRRGSDTTLPITEAPIELQQLWNRGNEEGISMIKVRKYKERYETKDGKSFRVHNYGKVSLNEVLPKNLRTGQIKDEVRFNEKIKVGEKNPTMTILRVPNTYKTNPNFNRDIESSFKALKLDRSYDSSFFRRFLKRVI
tara:strand:+ start:624 stop:1079 length:456 start_codon:yes stop_codon:yes gene_type:complete